MDASEASLCARHLRFNSQVGCRRFQHRQHAKRLLSQIAIHIAFFTWPVNTATPLLYINVDLKGFK